MSEARRKLRSSAWFGGEGKNAFMHRSWMKNQGIPDDLFDGKPVIGICNTFSELTPCNAHLRGLAEHVKRGVYEAGGLPLEFPVMSTGESNMRPTAMLFRNLASMDVEESIRGNPMDGVILLVGCDKTTPALMMGAASCDLPTIVVSGGPMLTGTFRGEQLGSGTDVFRQLAEMGVAGCQFRPGVANADNRLAFEFVIRNALILHPATVHETVFVLGTKPLGGAQLHLFVILRHAILLSIFLCGDVNVMPPHR